MDANPSILGTAAGAAGGCFVAELAAGRQRAQDGSCVCLSRPDRMPNLSSPCRSLVSGTFTLTTDA